MTRQRISRLAAIATVALCVDASGAVVSGYFNDPANTALLASDGYADLQAPRFANDGEIARNVAAYELTVLAPGTVEFVSVGYALGGAEPYFTLFTGTGTGATFLGSSFFDPNIDFAQSFSPLAAGAYTFALGVWVNMSIAENNPDSDPTLGDGFSALGDPGRLGNYLYQLNVTSTDGATFEIAPATGLVTAAPPGAVPEPGTLLLIAAAAFALGGSLRVRGCKAN